MDVHELTDEDITTLVELVVAAKNNLINNDVQAHELPSRYSECV